MGGLIANLCCVPIQGGSQKVVRLTARKQKGDTLALRAGRVGAVAISYKAPHFAVRYGGVWYLFPSRGPQATRTFPSEDAAAMWLMHRSTK